MIYLCDNILSSAVFLAISINIQKTNFSVTPTIRSLCLQRSSNLFRFCLVRLSNTTSETKMKENFQYENKIDDIIIFQKASNFPSKFVR